MSGYDLKKLSNANDTMFNQYVRVAYKSVTEPQLKDYFKVLLSHFTHKLHTKVGCEILTGICNGLLLNKGTEIFEENKFIFQLPFQQKQFVESVLDVLFVLVNKVPTAFDEKAAAFMGTIIPISPRKCLTIISFFAQQFEKSKDPMPMLDLLFHKSESFRGTDCAFDYISLLIWLLQEYQEFRDERLEHCWSYLCDMLTITNGSILSMIYNGLCAVYEISPEKVKEYGYPSEAIACHIQHRSTRAATISLLLRYPPPPDARYIDQLILSLVEIAKSDDKATLLLLSLAMQESNAEILVKNSEWMSHPLPKTLDTLRLFGIVILHVNLRKKIMESNYSIPFFMNLLQINSVGVCNAVCNIMKRLPLTEEYVASLSSSGFLSGYFNVVPDINDKSVQLSALRLIDTLARVRFVPEFMTMIEFVVKLCNSGGELALPAAAVAARLVRYPKCAKELKRLKLDEFFKKPIDDPRVKKYGDKFLQVLSMIETV